MPDTETLTPSTSPEQPQPVAPTPAPVPATLNLAFDSDQIKQLVIDVLRTVYDPEIPVDIYELGLIYDISVEPPGNVHVLMTLTAPACPVAGSLPGEVEEKLMDTPGISNATVELTWEPPWDRDLMSEEAKLTLGLW
ncbi:MAG: DUF59 domain-containing protein [Chlorobi bacterium]|nr:DUF59 domain-containing protein [Chlorobiota bacterium]